MMGMTATERQVVAEAVEAGTIGKGDNVECMGGLFMVASVERRGSDIHVVMVESPRVKNVDIAFRVGGDAPGA